MSAPEEIYEDIYLKWPTTTEEAIVAIEKLIGHIHHLADALHTDEAVRLKFRTTKPAIKTLPNRITFTAWRRLK